MLATSTAVHVTRVVPSGKVEGALFVTATPPASLGVA
jgi:hypothetical protein